MKHPFINTFLSFFLILIACTFTFGQGSVGIGTTTPDSSAILDVVSTTKGILVPRLTSAQRLAMSGMATGLLIYETDSNSFKYYTGTEWIAVSVVQELGDLNDAITDYTKRNIIVGNGGSHFDSTAVSNTAFGAFAMQENVSGEENIAIGLFAKYYGLSGDNNIAIGPYALAESDGGDNNIGIGRNTLFKSFGNQNLAIGNYALDDITSGSDNVGLGLNALSYNVTGNDNVAIGNFSLYEDSTGMENVAIGASSLSSNVHGSGNVAIGHTAGFSELGSNKLYIENSTSETPLIWGDFANDSVKIYGSLSIKDEYTLPAVDGSIGQTMKTDGNGNLTWQDDASSMNLNGLSDAKTVYAQNNLFGGQGSGDSILPAGVNNTAWGMNALNSTTIGNDNTAVGEQALSSNLAGEWNTAVGTKALQNSNSDSNTAIGQEVLKANVAGARNTGVGAKSLWSNVSGSNNTAIGERSMESNESGIRNVALGSNALQSNISGNENIAIGDSSMNKSEYGINNIAIGKNAMQNSLGSENNIAIGRNTLLNTTGTSNIAVGHFALENNNNGFGNSAFGYSTLRKSGGEYNSAFGYSSLENNFTDRNTAFGTFAGYNVTSGRQNALFGSDAMWSNKSGRDNSVFGDQGLATDTIGSYNTVMGSQALFSSQGSSNNTCIGYQAGFNTNGGGNVFLGHQAGFNETGGHFLYIDNTSTSDPLIWGDFIDDSITINGSLTSENDFNANAKLTVQGISLFKDQSIFNDILFVSNVSTTNYVYLDSTSIATSTPLGSAPQDLWLQSSTVTVPQGDVRLPTDVSLGIGTTSNPTHALTIENSTSETLRLIGSGTNGAESRMNFGDADYVYIDEPTDDIMRIQANRIGVRRDAASNELELEGDASKTTAGNWLANSDRRIKTDINEVENSFDLMKQLRPVTFNYTEEWKEKHPSIEDRPYYNFIAQEYGSVFPHSLQGSGEFISGDKEEILQIDTYDAQIVTIQAVKDLIKENEGLKEEVNELKTALHNLNAKVSTLISNSSLANSNE